MTKKSSVPAVIDDIGEKIGGARKDVAVRTGPKKAKPAEVDTRPGWARRFQVTETVARNDGRPVGTWALYDTRKTDWRGQHKLIREFPSKAAAEQAIPLAAVSQNHRVSQNREGKFVIVRDVTDRKRVQVVKSEFPTREAALEHMAKQAAQIIETKTNFGEEILARPEKVFREGPKFRSGDVRPDQFNEFGFRGVEFGNWQNQAERQQLLNHAYDGMHDLAHVTGLSPKALSLNDDLALAFGARGHGGKGAAAAHYERDYAAINLTKMSGAGSLAHEWWHAVDHYLGRKDDPALAEWTQRSGHKVLKAAGREDVYASHRISGYVPTKQLPDPVRAAYKDLLDTLYKKPVEYVEDQQAAEKFASHTETALRERLDNIRKDLASKKTYGTRFVEPASPAQLARFDAAAEKLIAGKDLSTTYKMNAESGSARNARGGFNMAGRHTNDTLDEISKVYKEVRGRSGFDSQNQRGPIDEVRYALKRHADRLATLKDAAAASTKVKMVPTEYAMNAQRLDQGRASDYWQTKHEMTARAFSAYIEDKIAEQGRKSDFLSYGSDNAFYKMFGERPFPEGQERAAINAKFDALFEAMKQAEVVKASAPSPANMLSAMSKGSAEGQQTMVTGQNGKPNPGWSDEARAKSAEVRAAQAVPPKLGTTKPPADLLERAKAMGIEAQRTGRGSAPAQDAQFMKLLSESKGYKAVDLMTAWSKGWTQEHASQPVPGITDAETIAADKARADQRFQEQIAETDQKIRQTLTDRGDKEGLARYEARKAVAGDNGAPPDTQLKAAKRLEEVAKRTIAEAEKTINQPRLMNTARRARLGGGVIEDAQHRVALAKTALKIADALRDGTAAPELAKISSLADVARLDSEYRQAMYAADRAKKLSYAESRSGLRGGMPTIEDIPYAKPSASVLANMPSSNDFGMLRKALKNQGVARELSHLEKLAAKGQHRHSDPKDVQAVEKVAKAIKAIKDKPTDWAQYRWQPKSLQSDANRWLKSVSEYRGEQRLGLSDQTSLQKMLRSYADVRQVKPKLDPVVAAERALIGTKIPGFFPTPQSLAARMADLAEIKPGMTVLEPSAGTGRLADAAKQRGAKVEAIEVASSLRDILTKKGHEIIGSDFNEVPIAQRYDRIMMNPPFEKGQDMAHVRRAYDMLKPGGKMVAVMGEGGFFRSDKQAEGFRQWLREVGGMSEKLPEGTFKESNTGVNTRLVTITKPGVNPGWSDAARLASAEVRAAAAETPTRVLSDSPKPMSAAMQRALETSQAKAAAVPSTLAKPAPVAPAPASEPARAVSRQEFMAQAEVRAHPEGGHEVRGPGTNGQWVRTKSTGTPAAAKLVAFTKHIGNAANKLGAIAMIAGPVTAAALAYDATRNQAAADGLTPTQQTTHALAAATLAGATTAGVGYGIMKGIGLLAKASPKIIGRALPGVGLGLMAYGAYQGAQRHGWKGAVLGAVGADGLLDLGTDAPPQIRASLPAPTSLPDAAQKFEVANDAFNAMQQSAASERILHGFQNPNNLAAALAAQGKELGRPAHGKP